ncbi:hypothetical protein J8J14_09605 [Roseomonas sp. SSH11]|uniref:Uncharacterized protein n=1 Tax=Pararoseomonas baculiformis TaxID=2820812 RepID=A0ABS4ADE5_9PROT|nr:hypothetical protein [Pararoseomonas baculiformis]MBP0445035.1 hypothetical protein [Pararoseomonas baculiformis]
MPKVRVERDGRVAHYEVVADEVVFSDVQGRVTMRLPADPEAAFAKLDMVDDGPGDAKRCFAGCRAAAKHSPGSLWECLALCSTIVIG